MSTSTYNPAMHHVYPNTQPYIFLPFHNETLPVTQNKENLQHTAEMIDELSRPYVPTTHTKFSPRIANFPFPLKTKMPANVKTYDALGDPDDHLELFTGAAIIERWSVPLWCHMFTQTMTPGNFSFEAPRKPLEQEGSLESLLSSSSSLGTPKRSFSATLGAAQSLIQLHSSDLEHLRYHDEDKGKNEQFTVLTKTPKEILATEEARFSFHLLKPLKGGDKNNEKFCDFHGDVGHHTNDCFQLRKRIEVAVKSGELAHLIKDLKDKKTISDKNQGEKDKKNKEIMMVSHISKAQVSNKPRNGG
ncbi:hypothetical protein E3N88_31827 [Mikania micrantha]|uniref:Reverse transcriptase domain-containing protein n=1 Tax=Mikania micrantha TaxID=192012 RepID=A0A5N6M9D8_9ASTR|nr:hypothetical protein E3N88_31827 [Mikania micrantha]